jgi:hypothetical protein
MSARVLLYLAVAAPNSCAPDPLKDDAAAYVGAVEPLVRGNMEVHRSYLGIAGQVKKGEINGDQIHTLYGDDLLPRARTLAEQAALITPATPQLQAVHLQLVEAWKHRVTAYEGIDAAWKKDDITAWDAAARENLLSKAEEERYFEAANAILTPYGHSLDPFPSP